MQKIEKLELEEQKLVQRIEKLKKSLRETRRKKAEISNLQLSKVIGSVNISPDELQELLGKRDLLKNLDNKVEMEDLSNVQNED